MLGEKSKISAVELLKNSLVSQDFSEAISEFSSSEFVSPFLEFAKLESEEEAKFKAQELLDVTKSISELDTEESSKVIELLFRNRTELGGNVLHALIYDARFSPANQLAVIGVLFNSSTFRHRLLNEKDIKDETPIEFFKQFLDKDFDGFAKIGLMALDLGIKVSNFLHHAMRHKNNDLVAAIYKHPNHEIFFEEQFMYLKYRSRFREFYPAFEVDSKLSEIRYSPKNEYEEKYIKFFTQILTKISNGTIIESDDKGRTPLHWASYRKYDEAVKLLIKKVADVHARDYIGATPLHFAVSWQGRNEIVKILIANGANVDATNDKGQTALRVAVGRCLKNDVIDILLDAKANINRQDNEGETPLQAAALYGYTETVKFLIERGAIPTEELRKLVTEKHQADEYKKESYEKILKLFDEYFKQQQLKAALSTQGSTSSNMLSSAAVTEVPNGAIVNLTESVTAMFINQLSDGKSTETGKGV